MKGPKPPGSKQLLRDYFLANIGTVLSSSVLSDVSGGASEWARRVRELRDEDGYQIKSHRDLKSLRPGQYLLETAVRQTPNMRALGRGVRALVLDRDGHTCQMCGLEAGAPDPRNPLRKVQLQVGHIIDKSQGGDDTPSNLRALCSWCNEGASNAMPTRPSLVKLITQVRRATIQDQAALLLWLQKKFGADKG